jgi:glycosyltransferase involved in cell wall biosynthesis
MDMKVLIVAFHSRSMTPYSELYENVIKNNNDIYDIIFWDRFSNNKLERKGNEFIIHKICSLGGNKFKKIVPMFYFRKTVNQIIKNGNYDRIIILNTLPAVLLSNVLISNYKGKYILDIRDYTYEKYKFYKKRVDNLVKNSFITTVSSFGFFRFLENNKKIYLNHNISNWNIFGFSDKELSEKPKIKIGFVGVVRYMKENMNLMRQMKNNEKYEFIYIGNTYPECNLEKTCKNENIENVTFKGEFNNKDKPEIYKEIDIINALYGNESLEVQTALPNKLYDAIIFKKPMIVSKGTYLAELVEKYKIGITVDFKENFYEVIEKYIAEFHSHEFNKNANMLLYKVICDQRKIKEKVKCFIKYGEKNE